jgi:glucose/arabinose dehydrogenase
VPNQVPEELSDRVMTLTPVLDGLRLPTAGIAEPGTDRWYILEKEGWVRQVVGGVLQPQVVLDIEGRVWSEGEAGERGLVGIALHPGFERNRRVFLSYTDTAGDLVVVEHQASEDGAAFSEDPVAEILRVGQPGQYHHGGRLVFGPDGYLWIGLGDGGGGGPDPHGHAQNPSVLLGSLLRIDIDAVRGMAGRSVRAYAIPPDNPFVGSGEGAPEVWAYGLRNPWGFSFDGGVLYIADVGDVTFEEINIMPTAESRGVNFGWGAFEGPLCIKPDHCDEIDSMPPILTLSRPGLCAVIGGPVYRGSAMPRLVGHFVYSDYCTGAIVTVKYEDGEVVEHLDWRNHTGPGYNITGLFEDGFGEIHAIERFGQILRLDPVD